MTQLVKGTLEDGLGNIFYPETSSDVVIDKNGISIQDHVNVTKFNTDVKIYGKTLANLIGRAGYMLHNQIYTHITTNNGYIGTENDEFVLFPSDSTLHMNMEFNNFNKKSNNYYIAIADMVEKEPGIRDGWFYCTDIDSNISAKRIDVVDNKPYIISLFKLSEVQNSKLIVDVSGDADSCIKIKNVRVYSITKDEYDLFDTSSTECVNEILTKYPYVDDIRCIKNPRIKCTSADETNNISKIYFNDTLYDGEYIELQNNNQYIKHSIFGELELTKDFFDKIKTTISVDKIGEYTRVWFKQPEYMFHSEHGEYGDYAIRYDGTILPTDNLLFGDDKISECLTWDGTTIRVSIPNYLCGWGSNYTPSQEEIEAFFLGWTMYDTSNFIDGSFTVYNGEGTKAWVKIWCGDGGCSIIHGIKYTGWGMEICPTIINDANYTPYKLIYRLSNPVDVKVNTNNSFQISDDCICNGYCDLDNKFSKDTLKNLFKFTLSTNSMITKDHIEKVYNETNSLKSQVGSSVLKSIPEIEIHGRTLANLLDRNGNGLYRQITDENVKESCVSYDGNTVKLTVDDTIDPKLSVVNYFRDLNKGKYVIFLAEVKSPNSGTCNIDIGTINTGAERKGISSTTSSEFVTLWLVDRIAKNKLDPKHHFSIYGDNELHFRNARAYYITIHEYNKINNDPEYTGNKLIEKFPYVDDVKPLINPTIYGTSKDGLFTSSIEFNTNLHDNESIKMENGKYIKKKVWQETNVDKDCQFYCSSTKENGTKKIEICLNNTKEIDTDVFAISYNGKILPRYDTVENIDEGYYIGLNSPNLIELELPNSLTGWGDDYTPTPGEVYAFFLGWTMYRGDDYSIYNGDGEKYWAKLWCGIGDIFTKQYNDYGVKRITNTGTKYCPTKLNDQGYTPYKLIYKLQTPIREFVNVNGSLTLSNEDTITSVCNNNETYGNYGKVFFVPITQKDKTQTDVLNKHTLKISHMEKHMNNNIHSPIEVTVGDGGDFSTINEALEHLCDKYPHFVKSSETQPIVTIKLLEGFIMKEQVLVYNLNLGWITIIGEDDETIINRESLNVNFYGRYPAFGVYNSGVCPIIGQLFNMDDTGENNGRDGLFVCDNSNAKMQSYSGFRNVGGNAIYASRNSNIVTNRIICDGAKETGIYALANSNVTANHANVKSSGMYGICVSAGSHVTADESDASGCKTYGIYAHNGSHISAINTNANSCLIGLYATLSSSIRADSCNISSAKEYGLLSSYNSAIYATCCDVSNASSVGIKVFAHSAAIVNRSVVNNAGEHGIVADECSSINADYIKISNSGQHGAFSDGGSNIRLYQATITNSGNTGIRSYNESRVDASHTIVTGSNIYGIHASKNSMINAVSSNARKGSVDDPTDIRVGYGSIICADGAVGGLSQAKNTMTSMGIIF